MTRSLDVEISLNETEYDVSIYDHDSGDHVRYTFPIGDRKHKELNDAMGEEIYSWVDFMLEEVAMTDGDSLE